MMTTPNALIVGVNKSATTSVFNALAGMADVCASSTKETHFFDPLKYGETLPPLSNYEQFFAHYAGETVTLEATPGYFYGGLQLAQAIANLKNETRVIIVLRDPVSRAYSWFRHCRTRLLLPQEMQFPEYVDKCLSLGLAPESDQEGTAWRGLSGGQYSHWMPAWQETFGDKLLIVFHDDISRDFDATMSRICSHLNLMWDHTERPRDNVSIDIKSSRLQTFALKAHRRTERLWRRFPTAKKRFVRFYFQINGRPTQDSEMSSVMHDRLWTYFNDSLQELKTQIGPLPAAWDLNA